MRRELTVIAIVKDYVRILRSDVFAHARFLVVQNSKFKQVQLQVSDMPIALATLECYPRRVKREKYQPEYIDISMGFFDN
jgi:hypothetical protein